jgi:phosphoglycolate phosphatase
MINKAVLFDLDGTLTDPQIGIVASIQFALTKLGFTPPDSERLLWCIGPPLTESFAKLIDTEDVDLINTAIGFYRERYATVGLFENSLYPDIPIVLNSLQADGYKTYVATSKPQIYAQQIIEYFGMTGSFDRVYGSELDGTRSNKGDLIQYILQTEHLAIDHTVMVGDRSHDIIGANRNGLDSIGVTYGYGTETELIASGADAIAHSPTQILHLLNARDERNPTFWKSRVSGKFD